MSISSQLPPITLAQASASLRALAQAAGQTVEARVLSQASNGTSQVLIGRQVLSLALPEGQVVGSTLTLSVQQADGQLRLAVVAVRPPATPGTTAPQPAVSSLPATTVQLSAAALASSTLSQPAQGTPAAPGAAAVSPKSVGTPPSVQAAPNAPPAAVATNATAPGPATAYAPPQQVGAPAATSVPSASSAQALQAGAAVVSTNVAPGPSGAGGQMPAPTGVPVNAASPAVPAATRGSQGPVAVSTPLAGSQAQSAAGLPSLANSASAPVPPGQVPMRADIPYAVVAPSATLPQVAGVTGAAASGLPPVAQMAAGTMVGQHAPSPNAPPPNPSSPGASGAGLGSVPSVPPPAAPTPQAALAQMVQQSMPRQDSIVGLTTALTAIAGKVALPEPVAKAAQQMLAARLPLDGVKLSGAGIKTAVQLSGVFQEALLASGQGQVAAGDLKSALLTLRQTLGAWLGNQAPVTQVSGIAPPIRGHIPRARTGDGALPSLPDDPVELGRVLAERTDAALSRLRLHQNASLPDPTGHRQDAQWSMDLPVIVGGQQQLLHMQIQRDAEQEAERSEERSWQVRFAINLAERGEVGAQISLRARNTAVLLWADHAQTAQALAGAVDELRETLGEVGLVAGAIVVRAGAPPPEASQPATAAGHVLDATR